MSQANPFVSGKRILFPRWGRHQTQVLGTFSCHWAAVAAFVRIQQPDFKNPNGDDFYDLKEEVLMKARLEAAKRG